MNHSLSEQLTHAQWRPILPSQRRDDRRAFHVSMLLPGLSNAYHQSVLERGSTAIREYRAAALAAAERDPELERDVITAAASITPADGMLMARVRGSCQMPFWSRVAIVEYRKQGCTIPEIATAFHCSPRTVVNVIGRTVFLSPHRKLTQFQLNPPSKISPKHNN